jgi:hypothetical protein
MRIVLWPQFLACTAPDIKNPGPAIPPRISRVDLPGAGAIFPTLHAFSRKRNPAAFRALWPGNRGRRPSVKRPASRTRFRAPIRAWPPGRVPRRGHVIISAPILTATGKNCSQQVSRPCLNPLCRGHGILTGQPGEDREQRAQAQIIGQEHLLGPVKHPPLAARPAHAGCPVREGDAGRAAGNPCFPARASRMAPPPVPVSGRPAERA